MQYSCDETTITTRLTAEYGLLHPFVGAGMAFVAYPPLAAAVSNASPRRNLDEEVWMPHTKSFLFNRNSRSRTCSASVPYTPLRFARNHTIGNACAIPGGRKSILRDAAAERFAVWPEDGRQQPPCLSKILRRFSTSIAVGRKGLCSNVITS